MRREVSLRSRHPRRGLVSRALGLLLAMAMFATPGSSARAGGGFEHGFPPGDDFFPLAVWLQAPFRAPEYVAIGINTFFGLWQGPTEEQLSEVAKQGIYTITMQNDVGLGSPNAGVIRAWMQDDEPDNAQPGSPGGGPPWLPCIPAAEVARRTAELKARDPSRPVAINFGRGVADVGWPGRGTCTGDTGYYDKAIVGADILAFDFYPVANESPSKKGKLEYVAMGVNNLLRWAKPDQAVWAVIETSALDPARPVKPAEVRSEVWMALIHGAKGITYFAHEFAPKFREDGVFNHPEVVEELGRINRTIKTLAPVLNTPGAGYPVAVFPPARIDTMTRIRDGVFYLFAIEMEGRAATARLAIDGISDGDGTVLNEDRAVAIRQGFLQDEFAPYGVHIYKVPIAPR